jgi:aminoglycoside phosphotransferase (APT) family kinase protein
MATVHSTSTSAFASTPDRSDLEPGIRAVLDRRALRKAASDVYRVASIAEVEERLSRFLASVAPGLIASGVRRLGGGASKEQFYFEIGGGAAPAQAYVLRMEPIQSISESDRGREADLLNAVRGIIPAPEPAWLDAEGTFFGQPAAIMHFVAGVTKPSDNGNTVTGLGTYLGPDLRGRIAPQFIRNLAVIHALDLADPNLASFQRPDADPWQAARWQVNWWARLHHEDVIQAHPVLTLAEEWMYANLPAATDLVMVHGDYRTGNYLFDEDSGEITAMLDWELAHIGDPHEDLAWTLQRIFGSSENGVHLASAMLTREDFIAAYIAQTGRSVNPRSLHFYEILSAYKCVVMTLATGMKTARDRHNHQDVLLTWLAPAGYIFVSELCRLLHEATAP